MTTFTRDLGIPLAPAAEPQQGEFSSTTRAIVEGLRGSTRQSRNERLVDAIEQITPALAGLREIAELGVRRGSDALSKSIAAKAVDAIESAQLAVPKILAGLHSGERSQVTRALQLLEDNGPVLLVAQGHADKIELGLGPAIRRTIERASAVLERLTRNSPAPA